MTALAIERNTNFAGTVPSRGTYPIKANTRIFKGSIVGLDSAGRAMPGDTIAHGCLVIVGKASATYDNRTGSVLGGAAAAVDVEVEFGVFQWDFKAGGGDDIAADDVGKVCFASDDHTVALTNDTDTLPIAGLITEFRDSKPYVWMGPHVAALVIVAAGEVSQLDAAQISVAALLVAAATASAVVNIPLTSFVAADATPLAKFASAGTPTFGLNLADSEALNIRWNNDAAPGTALCQVNIPPDLDDTAAAQLEFLCSKSGATVGDATTLTVTAFIINTGDVHDFDADCGGVTDALVGNAAAKTTKTLTLTISAANIQPGARSLVFTVTPTAGLLGTDDLMLHSVRLRYTRKILTS